MKQLIKFEDGQCYRYEHMDLAALMTLINTLAIIIWNKGAYIRLPVAAIGLIYDLYHGCYINNIVIRLALIAMNICFLML